MPTMAQWGSKKLGRIIKASRRSWRGWPFPMSRWPTKSTSTEEQKTTNERGTELFPSHSPPCCTQAQALTYGRRSRAGRLSSQK